MQNGKNGRSCATGKCPPKRGFPNNNNGGSTAGQRPAGGAQPIAATGGELSEAVAARASALEAAGQMGRAARLRQQFTAAATACSMMAGGEMNAAGAASRMATTTTTGSEECSGDCWPESNQTINCLYRQPDVTDCVMSQIVDDESMGQLEVVAVPDPLAPGWFVVDIVTPRMSSTICVDALQVTGVDGGGATVDMTDQVKTVMLRSVFTMMEPDGTLVLVYGPKNVAAGNKLVVKDGRCVCTDLCACQTAFHVAQLRFRVRNPQPVGNITVNLDYTRTWAEKCGEPCFDCGIATRCGQTVFVPAPTVTENLCPSLIQQIQQIVIENPGDEDAAVDDLFEAIGATGFVSSQTFAAAMIEASADIAQSLNVSVVDVVTAVVAGGLGAYSLTAIVGAAFDLLPDPDAVGTLVSLAETLTVAERQSLVTEIMVNGTMTDASKVAVATAMLAAGPLPLASRHAIVTAALDLDTAAEAITYLVGYSVARGGTFAADLKVALP